MKNSKGVKKNNNNSRIVDFAVPGDHRVKLKEFEKMDKYPDQASELKKHLKIKVTMIPIVIGALGYSHQRIGTMIGTMIVGLGNNGTGRDCPNYSIVEMVQNS